MPKYYQVIELMEKYVWIIVPIASIIVYAQSFFFGWVMLDDHGMIEEIVKLYPGLSSLPNVFAHEYASFYRPMQILTWALESFIGGNNPFIYHFVSVMLHAGVSLTVFYLFKRLEYKNSIPLIIALLFSVHPLFTHAVAWIPSRGDLLLTLFGILAFINYLRYKEANEMKYLILQTIFLLLALFSKETAAFIPLIILIYAFLNKKNVFNINYIYLYISWFVCIGIWYFMRSNAVSGDIPSEVFGIKPLLLNIQIIPELVGKFFLPVNLSTLPGFSLLSTVIGLVFMIGIIAILFIKGEFQRSNIILGLIWLLLFLLPALLFRLPHADVYYDYFEHRIYFASIGLFIFVAELIKQINKAKNKKVISYSFATLFIVMFAFTTLNAMNYKNGVKFWLRGVKTNPERPMLYNGLALSFQMDGKMELAEKTLLKSLKTDPNVFDTHDRLAKYYYNNGNKEKALTHFYESFRLRPNMPETTINLAVVLRELNRFGDAAEILKNALKFDDTNIVFYQNIIDNYKAAGNYDSAYKYIKIAEIRVGKIDLNQFLLDWGSYLSGKNDLSGAIAKTMEVINSDPDNLAALNQLGVFNAKSGNFQQALLYWEKALKINPQFLPALQNFYKFYLSNKLYDKALVYADLIEKAGGKIPEAEMRRLRGNL